MGQWLVVMAVAIYGPQIILVGIVGVGIWTNAVVFQLYIEVGDTGHIDVVHACLPCEFVGAVSIACSKVAEAPFVDGQLPVDVYVFQRQPAEVEADKHFVGIAQLVFDGAVKDDGIEVVYIETSSVLVVVVEGNSFKEADVQPVGDVEAQVMCRNKLGRIGAGSIAVACHITIAVVESHEEVLIIQSPHTGVDLQEEVVCGKIGKQQGTDAMADEIAVLPELYADGLYRTESDVATGLKEVDAVVSEAFGKVCTRIGAPCIDEGPFVGRYAHLVFGNKAVESHFSGDAAMEFHCTAVGKGGVFIVGKVSGHEVEAGIDVEFQIICIHLKEVGLALVEVFQECFFAVVGLIVSEQACMEEGYIEFICPAFVLDAVDLQQECFGFVAVVGSEVGEKCIVQFSGSDFIALEELFCMAVEGDVGGLGDNFQC